MEIHGRFPFGHDVQLADVPLLYRICLHDPTQVYHPLMVLMMISISIITFHMPSHTQIYIYYNKLFSHTHTPHTYIYNIYLYSYSSQIPIQFHWGLSTSACSIKASPGLKVFKISLLLSKVPSQWHYSIPFQNILDVGYYITNLFRQLVSAVNQQEIFRNLRVNMVSWATLKYVQKCSLTRYIGDVGVIIGLLCSQNTSPLIIKGYVSLELCGPARFFKLPHLCPRFSLIAANISQRAGLGGAKKKTCMSNPV